MDAWSAGKEILHREALGRVASVTVLGRLTPADRAGIVDAGLDLAPVSLQQLIVRLTQRAAGDDAPATISKSLTKEVR